MNLSVQCDFDNFVNKPVKFENPYSLAVVFRISSRFVDSRRHERPLLNMRAPPQSGGEGGTHGWDGGGEGDIYCHWPIMCVCGGRDLSTGN